MRIIGLADRDGLAQTIGLKKLPELGVQAVEFYLPPNLAALARLKPILEEAKQLDLIPSLHLVGLDQYFCLTKLGCFFDELHELDYLDSLVFHPIQATKLRLLNRIKTETFIAEWLLQSRILPCIEILPYDEHLPQRFGDRLAELWRIKQKFDSIYLCLDTGHCLLNWSRDHDHSIAHLNQDFVASIGHLHVHAYQNGSDHQPVTNDNGPLQMLLKILLRFGLAQSVVWSIEMVPNHNPIETIQQSVELLQSIHP